MLIMWSLRSSLIVCSAALILQTVAIATGIAQPVNPSLRTLPRTPTEAAERALKVLQVLKSTDEAHYVELGFRPAEDVQNLILGQSFPVFRVGLNQLKNFQPGDPNDPKPVPPTLVVNANRVIFLIIAKGSGGGVRSSITVTEYKGNGWKATRRGSPKLAHLLDKLRKSNPNFDTLISIPALNLYLLADGNTVQAGQFDVIPLVDISLPTLKLEAGKLLAAQYVFAKLAIEATGQDGSGLNRMELDEEFR